MGNPALYSKCYVGTKHLIEDYNSEVVRCLNWLESALPKSSQVEIVQKIEYFVDLRHTLGNTALVLSGGANLGAYHIGACQTMYYAGLLPRIISGSSAGAIIASFLCTRIDKELEEVLSLRSVNMNFLNEVEVYELAPKTIIESTYRKLSSLSAAGKACFCVVLGSMFDENIFMNAMMDNFGNMTFMEAYKMTRRILNITVSSTTAFEMPRLLNYITAPHVLIRSAVVASCSMPALFTSSKLLCKDAEGHEYPWNKNQEKWIDGSLDGDIPTRRLAEMFNVNHFIVSQVNPHANMILMFKNCSYRPIKALTFLFASEVIFRLNQLADIGFAPHVMKKAIGVLTQQYEGDITIIPAFTLEDLLSTLAKTTEAFIQRAIANGSRATWPKMDIIRNHCLIEQTLDRIIWKLREYSSADLFGTPKRPSLSASLSSIALAGDTQ